jgi:pimeloyl-ACP methyl ester carboxylesterase
MARKVMAQHDSWVIDNLSEVKVPTLVLVGEKDRAFLQAADYMSKVIPGAQYTVIPEAGHAANQDNAEAVNQAVLDFLDKLNLPKG